MLHVFMTNTYFPPVITEALTLRECLQNGRVILPM